MNEESKNVETSKNLEDTIHKIEHQIKYRGRYKGSGGGHSGITSTIRQIYKNAETGNVAYQIQQKAWESNVGNHRVNGGVTTHKIWNHLMVGTPQGYAEIRNYGGNILEDEIKEEDDKIIILVSHPHYEKDPKNIEIDKTDLSRYILDIYPPKKVLETE
jgi:hypothetical protein